MPYLRHTLKLIYHLLAHLFRLMRSFRSWSPLVLNFTIQRSLLSTMNLEISVFTTFYRSLKMMNKICPNTHPWSTLVLSFLHRKNPLNPILCFLLSNQLSVHKKTFASVPWQLCFCNNIAVGCYCKAFEKLTCIHIPFIYMHADSFIKLEKTRQTGFPIVENLLASAMIFVRVLSQSLFCHPAGDSNQPSQSIAPKSLL